MRYNLGEVACCLHKIHVAMNQPDTSLLLFKQNFNFKLDRFAKLEGLVVGF